MNMPKISTIKKISALALLGATILPGVYKLGYDAEKPNVEVHADSMYTPLQTGTAGTNKAYYPGGDSGYSLGTVGFRDFNEIASATTYAVSAAIPDELGGGGVSFETAVKSKWNPASSTYKWTVANPSVWIFGSYNKVEASSILVYDNSFVYCLDQKDAGPVGTTIEGNDAPTALQQLVLWYGYPNTPESNVGFNRNGLTNAAETYMATQYAVWMAGNSGKIGMDVNGSYKYVVPSPASSSKVLYAAKQLYNKAVAAQKSGLSVSSLASALKSSATVVTSSNASVAQSKANSEAQSAAVSMASLSASSNVSSASASAQKALSTSLNSEAVSVASSIAQSQYASNSTSLKASQSATGSSLAGSGLTASASGVVTNSGWNSSSASLGLGGSIYDKLDSSNAQHIFYFTASVNDKTSYTTGNASSASASGTLSDGTKWSTASTNQNSVTKDSSASAITVLNMTITGANGSALPSGAEVYAAPASQIDSAAQSGFPIVANGSAGQVFSIPAGDEVKVTIPFSATGGVLNLSYSVVNKVDLNVSDATTAYAQLSSTASYVANTTGSIAANTYTESYSGASYDYIQKEWWKATEYSGQPLGIVALGVSSTASGSKGNVAESATSQFSGQVIATGSNSAKASGVITSVINQSAKASVGPESYNGMWGSPELLKRDNDPSTGYKLLPDAGFNLYLINGSKKSLIGSYSTNSSGEIDTYPTVKIPWGSSYEWVETKVPVGYSMASTSTYTGTVGKNSNGTYSFLNHSMSATIYNDFVTTVHPEENSGNPFISSQLYDPDTKTTGYFDAGADADFNDLMTVRVIAGSYDPLAGTTSLQSSANDRIDATLNVVYADGTSKVATNSSGSAITASKTISIPSSEFSSLDEVKANRIIYVKSSVSLSFSGVNVTSLTSGESGAKLVVTEKVTDLDNVDDKGSAISASGTSGLSDADETFTPTSASLSTTATDANDVLGSNSTHDLYMYQSVKDNVIVSSSTFSVYDTDPATQKVTDSVPYSNLTAGKTYVVTGELYKNGKPYVDESGNTVTSSTTFTAPSSSSSSTTSSLTSGTTSVSFSFDGRNLEHGDKLVAHETIAPASDKNNTLASESNDSDSNQTVAMVSPYIFNNTQINVYTDTVSHGLNFDYYLTVTKTTEKSVTASMKQMIADYDPQLTVKDPDGNVLYSEPLTMADFVSASDLDSTSADPDTDTTSSNEGHVKQAIFRFADTLPLSKLSSEYTSAGDKVPLTFSITSGKTGYDPTEYETTSSTGTTHGYIASKLNITQNDLESESTFNEQSNSENGSDTQIDGETNSDVSKRLLTNFSSGEDKLIKFYHYSAPQVVTKGEFTNPKDIDEDYNIASLTDFDLKAGYGYQEGFVVSYTGLDSWNSSASDETDASNNDIATQMRTDIPMYFTVDDKSLSDMDIKGANNDNEFTSAMQTALGTTNPTGVTWKSKNWSDIIGNSTSNSNEDGTYTKSNGLSSSDIYDPEVTSTDETSDSALVYVPYKTTRVTYVGKFKQAYLSKNKNAFVRYVETSGYQSSGRQFFVPMYYNNSTLKYSGSVHYGTDNSTGTRFGQNYVQINIARNIDVYADRYLGSVDGNNSSSSSSSASSSSSTSTSKSNKQAELSLQPVYNNSDISGWNSSETSQISEWLSK